jgi:hypothetical protein
MQGFFAYPSIPKEIGEAATEAARQLDGVTTWQQLDIPGRFIIDPIFQKIDESDFLVADITRLNFNVIYEIGYAIGKQRRVVLVKSEALVSDDEAIREIGVFDTLGYTKYTSSAQLANLLRGIKDTKPLSTNYGDINRGQPIYLVLPRTKTDFEFRIQSRLNVAKLSFRLYDPDEQGRLPGREAIKQVATSHGVVVPLISAVRVDAFVHNLRGAFVAGLAAGLDKVRLLLQKGDDPVPLDYRDLVTSIQRTSQVDNRISNFAPLIAEQFQKTTGTVVAEQKTFLAALNLGASSAENEARDLGDYYLETAEFKRAAQGEAEVITGRKGSGKTALFMQLRDKKLQHKQTVVLDLKPEGFQLLKFKDVVLEHLEHGSKEHTIVAFWEYLLLLETCHKILELDQQNHITNHHLYEPYRDLAANYGLDPFISEGDFAERILKLTDRIDNDFRKAIGINGDKRRLTQEDLTGVLYKHDASKLREKVRDYLMLKDGLCVLFDNLDKGWPPQGLRSDDLTILRCLLEAMDKLERFLTRPKRNTKPDQHIDCHGMVFIRNDVYDLLLEHTSDRGKIKRISLDWNSPELLRELLRRRFVASGAKKQSKFEDVWRQICVSHIDGVESSSYIIERCLMRPRCLIDLLSYCQSHAVNLNHTSIEVEDIRHGEEAYSKDLLVNIGLEIRDVYPDSGDILYEFVGSEARLSCSEVESIIKRGFKRSLPLVIPDVTDYLLWSGFLGLVRSDSDTVYIYDLNYDSKLLKALISQQDEGKINYQINPAFWAGLLIGQQ